MPKRTARRPASSASSKLWLWMTALLGATFLGFQAYEFTSFVHEGLTIRTNLFGSSFFTLTGFHGAHVTAGVLWLLHAARDRLQARPAAQGRAQRRHRRAVLALRRRGLDRDLHARLPDPVAATDGTRSSHDQHQRRHATTTRMGDAHEHPTWTHVLVGRRSSSRSSRSSRSGRTTSRRFVASPVVRAVAADHVGGEVRRSS